VVATHAGADTDAREFAAHRVCGASFEPGRQDAERQRWRVGDERVHVVGLAVELDPLDVEFGVHHPHGLLAEGAHRVW
jgi:hypothetical protein